MEIILVLIIAAGAFFGGMKYQQSKTPAAASRFAGAGFLGAGRMRTGQAGGAQGGFLSGQILSINNGTITLQIPNNGGSKIVIFSSSTPVMKTVEGTAADLSNGTNVQIIGTANSDGSITARSIQLRNQTPPGQVSTTGR